MDSVSAGRPYMAATLTLQRLVTNNGQYASAMPFLIYVGAGGAIRVNYNKNNISALNSRRLRVSFYTINGRPENINLSSGARMNIDATNGSTAEITGPYLGEHESDGWTHAVVYFRSTSGTAMTNAQRTQIFNNLTI